MNNLKNIDKILILDFGSQFTQLIARRIRENKVYSEIHPFNVSMDFIKNFNAKGIVLSGGPSSVYEKDAPKINKELFEIGIPILGICYGMQLIVHSLGGKVEKAKKREYGNVKIEIIKNDCIFKSFEKNSVVWMSHGDSIKSIPKGFNLTAKTANTNYCAIENKEKNIYAIQFHPEVAHTKNGIKIIKNFIFDICKCKKNWNMDSFIEYQIKNIKETVGDKNVILGLSGGVDSSVAAVLIEKAIGKKLKCIFVNTGLLRKNEDKKVIEVFRDNFKIDLIYKDGSKRFLNKLKGVKNPERKRKIIGKEFINIFEEEAKKIKNVGFLAQGTLYPDIIESVSLRGSSAVIKSHHNVGGLPKNMKLKLLEPFRELFKDEVREIGKQLNLPEDIIYRQPFPGPGLAVRILGDITEEKIKILQEADDIVVSEIKKAGLYKKLWQSFAVLLPIKSVGVMGDNRTYEQVCAIRAVESVDAMTADWAKIDYEVLRIISNRIINEVKGINRVVYDISSKPPSTIEWE